MASFESWSGWKECGSATLHKCVPEPILPILSLPKMRKSKCHDNGKAKTRSGSTMLILPWDCRQRWRHTWPGWGPRWAAWGRRGSRCPGARWSARRRWWWCPSRGPGRRPRSPPRCPGTSWRGGNPAQIHILYIPNVTPETEFLDINLTKDSSLLLHANHSLYTDGFLKKARLYSGFKKYLQKINETTKLDSWIAFCRK